MFFRMFYVSTSDYFLYFKVVQRIWFIDGFYHNVYSIVSADIRCEASKA